jgi:hypothetical protein
MIDGAQPSNDLQGEDAIINAMQSSGLDSERLDDGNSKVGQIVVELRRVRLGTMRLDEKHRTQHREARSDDVDMDGQDITHTFPGHSKPLKINTGKLEPPSIS